MDFAEMAKAALEKRANVAEQRKALVNDLKGNEPSAEQRTQLESMDADINRLGDEARTHTERAEREKEDRALTDRVNGLLTPAPEGKRDDSRDLAADFRALALGETRSLELDFGKAEKRTATAGDHTGPNAGITSPTQFVAQVLESMRLRSDFMSRARTISTSGGDTLEWPVKTGRPTAGQVAENTAYGKSDGAWDKTDIGAYKYGVIVEATEEITEDSALDILGILAQDMGEAVADAVVADLLLGDGNGKPWGWVTRTAGAVNAATYDAVTVDDLLNMQHSIIAPYRRNAIFVTSDAMVAHLRSLKDANGQFLWQPSVQAGQPDRILGTPVITDPLVATAGASAKVLVYGDPAKYLIRQVRTVKVTRSDEYGWDRDVIAFKANWRGSGDLFDLESSRALTVTA